MNGVAFGSHDQSNHEGEEHHRSEEDPVDGLFLMIQVHENVSNEGSLKRRDQKTEDHVPVVETMNADIQGRDRRYGNRDAGEDEKNESNDRVDLERLFDLFG